MKKIYLILLCIVSNFSVYGNNNINIHVLKKEIKKITIEVQNYTNNTIQLGYYLGDKTFLKTDVLTDSDILSKQDNGKFVFNYENTIEPGIYLIVFKPDNNFAELLIPENVSDDLMIFVDARDPSNTLQVRGDDGENILFYSYINFLNEKRAIAQKYPKDDLEALSIINDEVVVFQKKFVKKHKNRLVGKILNSTINIDIPKFEGTEEEVQLKSWKYFKQHYFDNIDLSTPAMLRTNFLYEKVDFYIEKLTVQHPDSISKSIDFVLNEMKPAKDTYQYYVVNFLNKYAKSKIVGMDAVYVHIANNYYANGDAPWASKEQLDKIISNAKAIEPVLIGKIAPNLKLKQTNGIQFNLYDLKSRYTILFFWNEKCRSCLDEMSNIKKDEASLKKSGVEIVSIFSGKNEAYFQETTKTSIEMNNWLNTKITSIIAQDFNTYSITSFPQFFVLDKDKKILSKRIGAKQLLEVINRLKEM